MLVDGVDTFRQEQRAVEDRGVCTEEKQAAGDVAKKIHHRVEDKQLDGGVFVALARCTTLGRLDFPPVLGITAAISREVIVACRHEQSLIIRL
jgi:hypothetical protein